MDYIKALSNEDIIRKLKKYNMKINFIPYHLIKEINDLNKLIPCIILLEIEFPVGHWACLFRNQEGINYFDPLGNPPDELIKEHFNHPRGRQQMNADYTYLDELLYNNNEFPIVYNEQKLQDPPQTQTCGYWCAVRLLCHNILNDDFNEIFMKYNANDRQKKIYKFYNYL